MLPKEGISPIGRIGRKVIPGRRLNDYDSITIAFLPMNVAILAPPICLKSTCMGKKCNQIQHVYAYNTQLTQRCKQRNSPLCRTKNWTGHLARLRPCTSQHYDLPYTSKGAPLMLKNLRLRLKTNSELLAGVKV